MEFKYYVYIIVGGLIVLMAIYTLLTHLFPSISFKKHIIEVEFSETIVIPDLAELGEFTYSRHDKELQNEIEILYWSNFKISPINDTSGFELNFDSDDKKINLQQVEAYKSILNYSNDDWQNVLTKILEFYNKYYSDLEELLELKIESSEDLKKSIELNSILIHQTGIVGMSFNCTWDEEHGLGIRIYKNNEIKVGEASEAY